jgi:putative transposase
MGEYIHYPHAPPHLFTANSVYMVTAGTYQKQNIFTSADMLQNLEVELLHQTTKFSWKLHAWVILPNHYHFIGTAPADSQSLVSVIRRLHSITAKMANVVDDKAGRRVWHNYWDTCITSEKSYLRHLKYVFYNPVKHGFVSDPETYPFCNYKQFIVSTDNNFVQEVLQQQIDSLSVRDDY